MQKPFQPKNGIPQHLYFRRFRVIKEPRHPETISAKKRYISTPLFATTSGY